MKHLCKAMKWIGSAALAAGLSLGVYLGVMQLSGNVHTVIAGELYRSGQLSGEMIESLNKSYGIRTILNLRGSNPDKDWYRDEIEATSRLGINHIDFPMSSRELLDDERAKEIIALMRAAPKPLLIHCMGGADRSGLISALYLRYIADRPHVVAEGQLSLYFGHFAVPVLSKAYAMDVTWDNLPLDKTAMDTLLRSPVLAVAR